MRTEVPSTFNIPMSSRRYLQSQAPVHAQKNRFTRSRYHKFHNVVKLCSVAQHISEILRSRVRGEQHLEVLTKTTGKRDVLCGGLASAEMRASSYDLDSVLVRANGAHGFPVQISMGTYH